MLSASQLARCLTATLGCVVLLLPILPKSLDGDRDEYNGNASTWFDDGGMYSTIKLTTTQFEIDHDDTESNNK